MASQEGIVACPGSDSTGCPLLLSWANLADSGEYIAKEALELEKNYGGFTLNSDFLINQCVAPRRSSPNGRREGSRSLVGASGLHVTWVQLALVHRNHAEKATASPTNLIPPAIPHRRKVAGPSGLQLFTVRIIAPTVQSVFTPQGNPEKLLLGRPTLQQISSFRI
ncbi:hypothetical protein F0562_003381 [Nyssa sinensis]|uniref:Uncharacterized protein n=1 Tax=Nyssa sinensis TaxID=561372 RepID=A0A5J5BZ94_9ASTE|nr:hypothetical protein F0562_003381 [Nyssa sinensis]